MIFTKSLFFIIHVGFTSKEMLCRSIYKQFVNWKFLQFSLRILNSSSFNSLAKQNMSCSQIHVVFWHIMYIQVKWFEKCTRTHLLRSPPRFIRTCMYQLFMILLSFNIKPDHMYMYFSFLYTTIRIAVNIFNLLSPECNIFLAIICTVYLVMR